MEMGNKNMVALNPDISIVILNINGLKISVKGHIAQLWKNNFMISEQTHSNIKIQKERG